MTAFTTAAISLKRHRPIPNTCSAHLQASGGEQRVVINQPLEKVLAWMRADTRFVTEDSCRADPTFHHVSMHGRRPIAVEFICYAVPGGTQITSVVQRPSAGLFPIAAMRSARRHAALSLCRLKDLLE